ncbi:hypothetical protein RJT34_24743 [Clitoria ternatea]|uniref:Protein IQ-DOMAIN 1 n=1 Tax=Clitoria ternatea TaxID=43366 RepID=A0AAN9ILB0_CLITE
MGRKGGGWFAAVKRVFGSDTKKEQKHNNNNNNNRSKLACFGHHPPYDDLDRPIERPGISMVPSLPPKRDTKSRSEAENNNEQSIQNFSLVLATAVAAGAAVAAAAQAAAEANRPTNAPRYSGKANEEIAATKIQTAFRGYLARRSLRGLRGLARLRTLVKGQSVQRQAASSLQSMQTLTRLQSQVRARKIRMAEENQALQRQMQKKRETELDRLQASFGEKWDDSSQSKEQIETKLMNRQIAAMRREKALAYASTHQQTWKNSSKPAANATFMDPNNPHWGWNWLERWMAARPWEGQNTQCQDHTPTKSAAKQTMSVGEITKLYTLRDHNHEAKNSPCSPKPTRPRAFNSPSTPASKIPSTNGTRPKVSSGSKVGSWGGEGDSRSMLSNNSENNRRHSIAVSPVRDDEILASSSTALPSHKTISTKVAAAKAKSKVPSPSLGVHKNNATPEKLPSSKRLSLPNSAASPRRLSVSNKVGNVVSKKNVATIPEEKAKAKNGGGSR